MHGRSCKTQQPPVHESVRPFPEGVPCVGTHITTRPVPPVHHSVGAPLLASVFVESELIELKSIGVRPARLTPPKALLTSSPPLKLFTIFFYFHHSSRTLRLSTECGF